MKNQCHYCQKPLTTKQLQNRHNVNAFCGRACYWQHKAELVGPPPQFVIDNVATMTIKEMAAYLGIHHKTLQGRLQTWRRQQLLPEGQPKSDFAKMVGKFFNYSMPEQILIGASF